MIMKELFLEDRDKVVARGHISYKAYLNQARPLVRIEQTQIHMEALKQYKICFTFSQKCFSNLRANSGSETPHHRANLLKDEEEDGGQKTNLERFEACTDIKSINIYPAKGAMFSTQASNEALKAVQIQSYETELQSETLPRSTLRLAEKAYT